MIEQQHDIIRGNLETICAHPEHNRLWNAAPVFRYRRLVEELDTTPHSKEIMSKPLWIPETAVYEIEDEQVFMNIDTEHNLTFKDRISMLLMKQYKNMLFNKEQMTPVSKQYRVNLSKMPNTKFNRYDHSGEYFYAEIPTTIMHLESPDIAKLPVMTFVKAFFGEEGIRSTFQDLYRRGINSVRFQFLDHKYIHRNLTGQGEIKGLGRACSIGPYHQGDTHIDINLCVNDMKVSKYAIVKA